MSQSVFRAICVTIGLFVAALPARADDIQPYAGVGLGGVLIDAGLGSKDAFSGYGILGADLSENYGVELRFGAAGKTSGSVIVPQGRVEQAPLLVPTPANISLDWFFSYLLKLQYPLNDAFRIYGVVGGTAMKAKFAFATTTQRATFNALSYGGGFDYNLGNQWVIGVDATVYANKANTSPKANFAGLDVWGVNGQIKYEF